MRSVKSGLIVPNGKRFPVFRKTFPDRQNFDHGKNPGHVSELVENKQVKLCEQVVEKYSCLALQLREVL